MKDNMEFLKKIFSLFRKFFTKEDEVKSIEEASKIIIQEDNKSTFADELIEKTVQHEKREVETLVCEGDGLGIKSKISC